MLPLQIHHLYLQLGLPGALEDSTKSAEDASQG
jgi:hypothetical protein